MIYGREKAKVPVTVLTTPVIPSINGNTITQNMMIDFVKEQDKRTKKQILKEIVNWAVEHKITTVYLIDEEFVKTALLNEIERRKKQ